MITYACWASLTNLPKIHYPALLPYVIWHALDPIQRMGRVSTTRSRILVEQRRESGALSTQLDFPVKS